MPSTKQPITTVYPGPGRLPANTITASALVVPGGGGGSSAALMAHINDPVDAHMAGAIGIPAVNPITGEPLLSSNVPPGVIDGESVLDFIAQFKDLLPSRPPYLGFSGSNTGVPDWGTLDTVGDGGTAKNGGYDDGAAHTIYSHYVVPNGTTSFTLTGNLYPADRGVLALYRNTSAPYGNFSNPFSGATLVGALYLGVTNPPSPNPAPVGVPVAGFDETLRSSNQPDYVASGAGVDLISLGYRYPYKTSYPVGVPYTPYPQNFASFQIARYSISQSVSAGNAHDWFLVHWRDTFAMSLSAIDPSVTALSLASLSASNCYSATPSASADFDDPTKDVYSLNRHHVFRDAASGTIPSLVSSSASITASTHKVSGISFYDNTGPATATWNFLMAGMFANAFELGGPSFSDPTYQGDYPATLLLTDFSVLDRAYNYDGLDNGVAPNFGPTKPPAVTDNCRFYRAGVTFSPTAPYTVNSFTAPYSYFRVRAANVWATATFTNPTKFLWNSWTSAGSTSTLENFVEESRRYLTAHSPVPTDRITPVGGAAYNSATLLSADTASLQIVGSRLVYPRLDFSTGYAPSGQPNYSTLPTTDGVNHLRRYVRVFDTGVARNTGKLRIRGLAPTAFQVDAPYDGTETTGHTNGGAIVQVRVPGSTGWLDVGRSAGDPTVGTSDYYGCSTGVVVSGSDVFVSLQTGTSFTADNGNGEFPLFVRVTFLNNAAGLALSLDELEWLPF